MKLTTNPLLKPLFTAIARLPLIGPHAGEEVALLRSGSKPVGMFGSRDPDVATLQDDVNAGRLIRLDVPRTMPRALTLYALPGTDMDLTEQAAIYHTKCLSEGPDTYPQGHDALKTLASKVSLGVFDRPQSTKGTEFIDGQYTVLLVPDYMDKFLTKQGLKEEFNARVADGRILARAVECEANFDMVVFGQPGREADMDTLALILRDGYAGKPLPEHIDDYAEGRILGYSDRDIDAFCDRMTEQKEMNWLLRRTHEQRRNLRATLMKEAGPNWPRNP